MPEASSKYRRPTRDASVDRSGCTAQRHGTTSAYDWWGCRCADAREAFRLYRKRLAQGRQPPALVPAVGTARRLQALVAIGYSWRDLAAKLGISNRRVAELALAPEGRVHRTTVARVHTLFEELSGTPGTTRYAFVVAARHGFAPPLAWDDIDDPNAQPDVLGGDVPQASSAAIDEVAIRRALAGEPVPLTSLERRHAVHAGMRQSMPLYRIAERLRVSHTTAQRLAKKPIPGGYVLAA